MAVDFKKGDQTQMSKWVGGRKKYALLFKVSRDGCAATTFHNLCNNKGPTVTILYNTNNSVYGGYTSVNWRSGGNYINDTNAFLFRLYQNGQFSPVKMNVNNAGYAVYDHPSYGPTFGGHDLYTFANTVTNNGTCFPLNGSTNFGHSYTMNGENYNSIANGHLQVKDLEVYVAEAALAYGIYISQLIRYSRACDANTDFGDRGRLLTPKLMNQEFQEIKLKPSLHLPGGVPLDQPWRKTPKWETKLMNTLKEKVDGYKPLKDLKVPQARILLIGQVGAGKSSFFNTVNSIFRGYITSQACSGNAEHSLTTVYRMYQVRNGASGNPMNFRLHDTRGLEADQGIDSHEMCYLLDGNLPDRHQFNPSVPISPDLPGFIASPHLSDKIHCVVFVLDASTVDVMPDKVVERIKSLQNRMNQRGIPQVVLLTKIDRICETTTEDISKVFYSPAIQEAVDKVSQVMGLPRSHVLPVKNYESEMELNEHVDILALMTLQQILHFADDYMYNYLDQVEEGKLKQLNIRD